MIRSTDTTEIAIHDFGGVGPPVLIVHATGFHAHCYVPMVRELSDRFRCWGLDVRGHGGSTVAADWRPDWRAFGDDVLAACAEIAPEGGIVGFGHSMGATSLLMAAERAPQCFDRLVLFEPIAYPSGDSPLDVTELPLVKGALRRRRHFDSFDHAYEHFRSKQPLASLVPDSLRQYVDHGFVAIDGSSGVGVELICPPELEAQIFMTAPDNGAWDLFPSILTRTTVIAGHIEGREPAAVAERIADELPNGAFVALPHLTHFAPLTHPTEIADLVALR